MSAGKPKASLRIGHLADLKQVKKALADQAEQRAQEAARQAQQQTQRALESNLFAMAAGAVNPLPDRRKVELKKPPPEPLPLQQQKDDEAVLQEAISDEFDVSTLLDVDEHLSFRRPGIGTDVTRKLRRGDWSIQRQLDLHGLRTEEAREALGQFIRDVTKQGLRCVRVVHGKGLGSPGKAPVLKSRVHSWLVQKKEILAFVQARPAEGGAGALVVLLQPGPAAHK